MQNRYSHLDVAKGIGIILVFIGHLLSHDSYIGLTIYSFHMPLFFTVSGVFAKTYKDQGFFTYLKKNIVHLLIPYIIFTLFGVLVTFSVVQWRTALNIYDLKYILYSAQPENWHVGQLWFLVSLFVVKIIFYFYDRLILSKNNTVLNIVSLLLFFVLAYNIKQIDPSYNWLPASQIKDTLLHYREVTGFWYPFQINSALMATPFYAIGYLLSDKIKNFKLDKDNISNWALTAICLVITILFARYNGNVNLGGGWYGDCFLYILFSLTGTFAVIGLSSLLRKSKYLAFLGQESMLIFALHTAVIYYYTYFLSQKYGTAITNSVNLSNRDCVIGFVILMVTMSAVGAVNVLIKKQRKGRKSAKKSKSQG